MFFVFILEHCLNIVDFAADTWHKIRCAFLHIYYEHTFYVSAFKNVFTF